MASQGDQVEKVNGTIIRIKRKRNKEPVNSLVIHHSSPKKIKSDSENYVFHLAGTVINNEVKESKKLIDEYKSKFLSSSKGSIDDVRKRSRKIQKEKQQSSRYKVLSKHRQDFDNENSRENAQVSFEGKVDLPYHVYDIEADKLASKNNNIKKDNEVPTAEELLCNSVKMIRESLKIYDETPKDVEYVYDVYFAPDVVVVPNDEFLDVEEYYENLVNELEEDDTNMYEDEDDENDEDNWRNDYPDEDDFGSSDDEHKSYHSDTSEDERYVYYGSRDYHTEDYYGTVQDYDDD